ncbi:MAG: HD domain-containing phosphohydrolase [Thermodesulfobacteriota bacterium]
MIPLKELARAKILIVDDAPDIIRLLTYFLETAGYKHIQGVTDSRLAMDTFREFRPDLVILDIIMPHVDGFTILEEITRMEEDSHAVLVLTSLSDPEIRIKALEWGARDFLTKPFHRAEALARIRNILQARLLYKLVREQNVNLEQTVAQRTRELAETRFQIIRCLGKAAEYKDEDTGLHIVRISKMAEALGKAAGLSPQICERLKNASPMHDIGKIGVPDHILQKKARLTPAEYQIMKGHTHMGADLLSGDDSELMKMARQIALTHHERWDGTGYPAGLSGEAIPVTGRIVAICDAFDALVSRRPYKNPWSVEATLAEMENEKGRHYDPGLFQIFLSILPEILKISEEFREADEPRDANG